MNNESKDIKDISGVDNGYPVVLISPEDGGFPRKAEDIERISSAHFKVNIPSSQDGHIMVEATNLTDTLQEIKIDINPDPRKAVFENIKCPKSHFYYCTPSGKWFRKHMEDGISRLLIPLEPGVTRIAGVPWFTYSEYISYVESLNDPRIEREVVLTHENGLFKVYRIKVTNPGGVKNKMKICFARANHTNETSGYFMGQGIIEWLLSGDRAANLDNIEWSFYLCPDPKAIYYHYAYEEIAEEIYDDGKKMHESFDDALKADRYHIVQQEHMWNNEHGGIMKHTKTPSLELESFEYNDPLSSDSTNIAIFPDLMPTSQVWKDYTSFWPHWFEYGTDSYFHRDGRHWNYALPGTLIMINEVIFYGKDSGGDLIANIKEQGKHWARATSQVYLRFQEKNNFWNEGHVLGTIDITGAVLLPKPEHFLAENMMFLEGNAVRKLNANGDPMVIFKKQYDHGLGMKAGESVVFNIPAGVNSFKANVAMDDASDIDTEQLQFSLKLNECIIWQSKPLKKYESQMAHVDLPGRGKLTLLVEGPGGILADWGGARFSINDSDMCQDVVS